MKGERIAIACDHAGYEKKLTIIKYLKEQGYQIKDFGTDSPASVDYPDYAHPLAQAINDGHIQIGITLCGSGNGINMTANKHPHVRSALCWQPELAALARQHNNANVCALPARFITDEEALNIVDRFLKESFDGGRHIRRIEKIPLKQ